MSDVGRERATMDALAADLEGVLRPPFERAGLGFVLVAFSKDGPGFARFVANVDEEQMVRTLKELVLRLEQGDRVAPEEDPP